MLIKQRNRFIENKWISFHIFIWEEDVYDELISDIARSFYDNNINNFFFIRYWEGGPHLRIRVWGDSEEFEHEVYLFLFNCVSKIIREHPYMGEVKIDKNTFYEETFTDGIEFKDYDKLPWYSNFSIALIPYIRELERYGGIEYIGYSEQAFTYSSKLAVNIINQTQNTTSKSLVFYFVVLNLVQFLFRSNDRMLGFCEFSEKAWMTLIPVNLEFEFQFRKVINGTPFASDSIVAIDGFKDFEYILLGIKNSLNDENKYVLAMSIIYSQLHMLANRLGVPIVVELTTYGLIKRKINEIIK
ncbi:lantibiotic dehydratase C-terminal domain-containing protein [Leuconostoc citreum]|uniref:lantibiotic dehydratase C-terminal domain-containing protein n=1 Tax=Leuconostoc citreum TaxID=33964 RepID=UPI0032DF9AD5